MLWPILWILAMLGLITATVVAAMREKKARAQFAAKMQPQPMDDSGLDGEPMAMDDDAFGGGGFDDGFGDAADPLAAMDEDAFK